VKEREKGRREMKEKRKKERYWQKNIRGYLRN